MVIIIDQVIRALSGDGLVSAAAISSKSLVERARLIHKASPIAIAALGRTLSAVSMMGIMQKIEDGSVTLQIKGGGPLGTILAVSDSLGNVRGYVQDPNVEIMEKYRGKLDVGAAVGNRGSLTVIRDMNLKEPYIGSIQLVSGEIAEDVTAYFAQSEQIPSVCALGVLVDLDRSVKASGGYIIQLMPGAGEETISAIEAAVSKAEPVTALLSKGLNPEQLIERLLPGFGMEILEATDVEYRCYCSRERVSRVLISLGLDELRDMSRSDEDTEIECQFCDEVYRFSPHEIEILVLELETSGKSRA